MYSPASGADRLHFAAPTEPGCVTGSSALHVMVASLTKRTCHRPWRSMYSVRYRAAKVMWARPAPPAFLKFAVKE